MSERLALLKAILANPDDDLVRLVYADWLDEHGTTDAEAARAEFIRLGCPMEKKKRITTAETKWIDANWQRLLPNVMAALPKGADQLSPYREGRFLQFSSRWSEGRRIRTTNLIFEFVRGFARRVEFVNGHGYERFWQAAAEDEPLAYHRPQMRPDARHTPELGPYTRILRTTWGSEVYERAIGFDEEVGGKEKVYRGLVRGTMATAGFYPPAVADIWGIETPQSRVCVSIATAMTARAREFVGLAEPATA